MKYFLPTIVVVCGWVLGTYAQGQPAEIRQSVIQLPQELKRQDQIYEDINQDGLKDLVVAVSRKGKRFSRFVRVYYQRRGDPGFAMEPDVVIPLTPDVIAYACADTDPQVGTEIVLFTANACFGCRLQEEAQGRIYKIADHELLWQIPDPYTVFSWQRAVLDFDRDDRQDICMPQEEGLNVLLQRPSELIFTPLLVTPEENDGHQSNVQVDRDQSGTQISFGFEGMGDMFGKGRPNPPLVRIRHEVHVPLFTDWNGDNRYDIVTQAANRLHVWQQGGDEIFPAEPQFSLDLPLDKDDHHFDFVRTQLVLDINRDGRCDYILFTRDRNAKKLFTQILVYLNPEDTGLLFGEEGIPQQLIKVAGIPSDARLEDINCDGYPDLSFVLFRPDLMDQVKTLASKSITLQFLAYFNKQGHFSRSPDMTQDIHVSIQDNGNSDFKQGRFFVDYNKDGLLDVLVRSEKTHIGLRLLTKKKSGIQIAKPYVWDMPIPENARLLSQNNNSDSESVLLIVGPRQIMHVRFP